MGETPHAPTTAAASGLDLRGRVPPRAFVELHALPDDVRPPLALWWIVVGAAIAGFAAGAALDADVPSRRVARGLFGACFLVYGVVTLADFAEHFRLEKALTGRYLRAVVVPRGETAIHVLLAITLLAFLALARPIEPPLQPRDAFVLCAPVLFLAIGWFDELRYHRRRVLHREGLIHTVNHLNTAATFATFAVVRLLPW